MIFSNDDWYITRGTSNMVVIETTNEVYDVTQYDKVIPQTVPCWIRITVANRMADDGKTWVDIIKNHASGTYNNQWIVFDLSKVTLGELLEGALWIAEEMPGMIHAEDMTDHLQENSYWSSYNIPFFPDIYNISGTNDKFLAEGEYYSHDHCPRGEIFSARQGDVESMDDMKFLLQYNDYKNDPLSQKNPSWAIAARGDLKDKPSFSGANDGKIASFKELLFSEEPYWWGRVGPTYDQQPVFCWSHYPNNNYTYNGQPDCFHYPWAKLVL